MDFQVYEGSNEKVDIKKRRSVFYALTVENYRI